MTSGNSEYAVDGYDNVQPGYDQPYLRGADFNPKVVFKNAGDPEKQEQHQKELVADLPIDDFLVKPYANPTNPTYPQTVDPGAVPYAVSDGDTESNEVKIANLERQIEALKAQPDKEPHQPNGEPLHGERNNGSRFEDGGNAPDADNVQDTGNEDNYLREPGDHNSQPVGDPLGSETTPVDDPNKYEQELQEQNASHDQLDAQGNENPEGSDDESNGERKITGPASE